MAEEHRILTKAKLADMIKSSEKAKKVEVTFCQTKAGALKGDNFSGEVVACDVKAKIDGKPEREFHWMVKVPPPDKTKMPMIRGMEMERKEIQMYDEVLPAWRKMIRDRGAEKEIVINYCTAPYTEFHEDQDKGSVIAMENLTYQGYRDAVNKRKGLNPDHVKLALEQIANHHALGYLYMKKAFPGGIDEALEKNKILARDYFISEPTDFIKQLFDNFKEQTYAGFQYLAGVSEENGQGMADALKRFMENNDLFEVRDRAFTKDPNGFNVLCHGDTWFNNMLFKY